MRVIDFFAGAGGSSLGAHQAGARTVVALNHWPVAVATLRANFPGVDVRNQDITRVRELPDAEGLLFSPECRWHTEAQGARRIDPRHQVEAARSRATAWQVVRWVKRLKPRWFVVENVPAFERWPLYARWKKHLEGEGYNLTTGLLNSANFGVPQARVRWFAVGHRDRQPALPVGTAPTRTVREAIDWTIRGTPIEGRRRPLCAAQLARITQGRAAGLSQFLTVYYKGGPQFQSLDRPCRTVTCLDRFGLVDGDRFRMLQPHELQEIMGFPPGYRLTGNRRDKIKQLGNAVPPPVMRHLVAACG